ncbi:OB-fold domain-containing protein [Pseudonocardia sp. RS11V-5]|uniref:Zn-ribbon domain-containing OB-fold protein n=1 Tax=Pseudonocardia terrae TaxID=2905831 RepID=UPI001E4DF9D6|nr:OB-fold domain-containing protein [Pseudonocardia terrae]MCE3550647.1 OB-fold domain-containing protein [Pseudonocardia terrae]
MTDWTAGEPQVCFDECRSCARRWPLPRAACPHCGTPDPQRRGAAGTGTVAALTVVHRAPEGAPHPPTPFALVLVDLDEGVRVMGRAAGVSAVGERVAVGFPDGVPSFAPAR